jgi:hypothetical protein
VTIRGRRSPTNEPMWRRLTVAGLSALLVLAALLLLNRQAVRMAYYKWQLRSAGEAAFAKSGPGHFFGTLPGARDSQARYSRARQALLDLGYLRKLELPFPAGSDWPGLLSHVRGRFPDGMWELSLDPSSSMIHVTAPTNQIESWTRCVSEFAVP